MNVRVAAAILGVILIWDGHDLTADEQGDVGWHERRTESPASLVEQTPSSVAINSQTTAGRSDTVPSQLVSTPSDTPDPGDLRTRLERQDQAIRDLQDQLKRLQQSNKAPSDASSKTKGEGAKRESTDDPSSDSGDAKKKDGKDGDKEKGKEGDKKKDEAKKPEWPYEVGTDMKPSPAFRPRTVPLAQYAPQRFHHALGRLDQLGQCVVGTIAGSADTSRR